MDTTAPPTPPFDHALLDELMDRAGIDVLLATSKHNVQYLLGGHRFFFFEHADAIGLSRYLPILGYVKGRVDQAFYVGFINERHAFEVNPLWTPHVESSSFGTRDAMRSAAAHIRRLGPGISGVGIETAFLPVEAADELAERLPDVTVVDALVTLERLRAIKRPGELVVLQQAADLIVDSMCAVFARHGPGTTKNELVRAMRREETDRGLTFEYCLVGVGPDPNLAPSEAVWAEGQPLSLDSGGSHHGYIGDLARMAIAGQPDAELEELLGDIQRVQAAARAEIRPGGRGGAIFDAGHDALRACASAPHMSFVVHGMGLVNHEAPRLTDAGPLPYPATDAEAPLQAGMVISVETTIVHPQRGFVKLEDTVAVTEEGATGFGDRGRGWNRAGSSTPIESASR